MASLEYIKGSNKKNVVNPQATCIMEYYIYDVSVKLIWRNANITLLDLGLHNNKQWNGDCFS